MSSRELSLHGLLAMLGLAVHERSLFLNYELMIAFFEPADVHRFARWIELQRDAAGFIGRSRPA